MNWRILMECCSASLLPILHTRFHTSFVGTSLEQRLLHSFMRLSSRHGTLLSTAAGLEPPTCQTQPQNGEIYTTLQHKVSSELEVKRSKFIAVAAPIYDEEGARAFLSEVTMILGVPFDLLGSIYPLLQSHQVGNLKHEYDVVGDGINQIKFAVDFDKVDTLEQLIKNSCHARVTISRI